MYFVAESESHDVKLDTAGILYRLQSVLRGVNSIIISVVTESYEV